MRSQLIEVFDITLQKTNEILKDIESQLGWVDRHKAYLALRSVLHTLRDRLPIDQTVAFGAQLPMLVRGFYYEGWKPAKVPLKMNRDEFIGEVERMLNPPFEQSTEEIIKGVIAVLGEHIDSAEMRKLKKVLPKDIVELISP